jgi:hypothetical protein
LEKVQRREAGDCGDDHKKAHYGKDRDEGECIEEYALGVSAYFT